MIQDEICQKLNDRLEKIVLLTSAEVPLCEFYEMSFIQHAKLATAIDEIGNELPNILAAANRISVTNWSQKTEGRKLKLVVSN